MGNVQAKILPLSSFVGLLFLGGLMWLPIFTSEESYMITWYPISYLAAFCGLWSMHFKIRKFDLLFLFLIGITGFINILVVGNLSLNRQIFIIMSVFISYLLMNPFIRLSYTKYILYINLSIVFILIMFLGTNGVYKVSTGNYVSVYAIELVSYYYVLMEHRGKQITVLPAIMTFFVCLFAEGRGGMLCTAVLLIGIWIVVYRKYSNWLRYLLIIITLSFVGIFLTYFVSNLYSMQRIPIFSHFARSGFESRARVLMWDVYIDRVFESKEAILCGYQYNKVPRIKIYNRGNPHNSILDIHGLHGGITFIVIVLMILSSYRWAWKREKWIYMLCFSVFMMRGFTDRMFWGASGTPVFFFFLLIPYHWKYIASENSGKSDTLKTT